MRSGCVDGLAFPLDRYPFVSELPVTPSVKLLYTVTIAVGAVLVAVVVWSSRRADPYQGTQRAAVFVPMNSPRATELKTTETPLPEISRAATTTPPPVRQIAYSPSALRAKLRDLLATKTGDTERSEQLLRELTALLTDANAADVVRSLQSEELNTPFGTVALERWLSVDPQSAATWIATRPDATEEQAWLVAKMLLKSPAALTTFTDALAESDFKEHVLVGGALAVVGKNPQEAIALAARLAPGFAQTNVYQTIAFDWATGDPEKALAWMMTLPDPDLREELVAVGAKAIAVTDPDLAAQWLSTSVNTESLFNDTALSLVQTWASKNPAQAAIWVARLSSPEIRQTSADIVARRWSESDPQAAGAWLAELPEGETILAKWQAEKSEREVKSDE